MSSSQTSHRQSIKSHDLRLLSSTSTTTPTPITPDISGPLTPDTVVFVNPFVTLNGTTTTTTTTNSSPPSNRLINNYELSETKIDDFKCARHIPSGEIYLYKEYPTEIVRQRLEPYERLSKLFLGSNINKQLINYMSIEQLAAKNHIHFYHDILTYDDSKTTIILYKNYLNNLHTYITDKHRLNENETKNLFIQIVKAIQMCHSVGLIIRDLKLRKIIFNNNSYTHLLITGLEEAIMLNNPTTNDDFVSSRFSCPVYACPEIVLNRQMYSGKLADSWSLGIILYTMLFGRYPFCDRTLVGLFIKIGRCRPDIPRTISIKVRSLLRSLLRVKPDERLLPRDLLGHVWFSGDRDLSSTTTTTTTDESYFFTSSNTNSTNYSNETTSQEDAVVPSFECE